MENSNIIYYLIKEHLAIYTIMLFILPAIILWTSYFLMFKEKKKQIINNPSETLKYLLENKVITLGRIQKLTKDQKEKEYYDKDAVLYIIRKAVSETLNDIYVITEDPIIIRAIKMKLKQIWGEI